MEIGGKLKAARQAAKLTQEQVAERLGVSRQTVSNWETGKTYPDIVSVVKLSDLYDISLDRLLKEEEPMSNNTYLNYLEESTDVVRSGERKAKTTLVSAYLAIWAFAIVAFHCFTDPSDAFGYSFMYLWVLLPVTTFVVALLIGLHDHWGRRKWLSAIPFGLMYMLAEYATFGAANTLANLEEGVFRLNAPEGDMIVLGAGIALAGIGIGELARRLRGRRRRDAA